MSRAFRVQGVVPPLITPLTDEHEVDLESLRRLLNFEIDAGINALWILGSTGEFWGLNERQRDLVIETSIEVTARRVPVLIGCIDTGPRRSIERARMAKAAGADGVFVTPPIYQPIAQAEILNHCRMVRDAIDLPLYLYNAQFATQTKIENATLRALAEDKTIVGLKDSSGDFLAFRELVIDLSDLEDFDILIGNDLMMDAALLMGAHGCVAAYANFIPEIFVALYRAARAGDWAEAARQQNLATAVSRLVKCGSADGTFISRFFSGTKTAMRLRGIIDSSAVNAPLMPAPEGTDAAVRRILDRYGVKEGVLVAPK